jgi:hypothetical protein
VNGKVCAECISPLLSNPGQSMIPQVKQSFQILANVSTAKKPKKPQEIFIRHFLCYAAEISAKL